MKPHISKQVFLGLITVFSIYCFCFINSSKRANIMLAKNDINIERLEASKDDEIKKVDNINLPDVEAVKKVFSIMKRLLSAS